MLVCLRRKRRKNKKNKKVQKKLFMNNIYRKKEKVLNNSIILC